MIGQSVFYCTDGKKTQNRYSLFLKYEYFLMNILDFDVVVLVVVGGGGSFVIFVVVVVIANDH